MIKESDNIITKEKAVGVTAIMPIILLSAVMVREFWAIFVIVGLLAVAYLALKQEGDKPKEVMALKQEQ